MDRSKQRANKRAASDVRCGTFVLLAASSVLVQSCASSVAADASLRSDASEIVEIADEGDAIDARDTPDTIVSSPDVPTFCSAPGEVRCGEQCNTATPGTIEACGAACTRCPAVEGGNALYDMGRSPLSSGSFALIDLPPPRRA